MSTKKIGINASFLRKPGTGIGQVSLHVLKELEKSSFHEKFIIFSEEKVSGFRFENDHFLPFYERDDLIRKILWEKFLLPKKVKQKGIKKFVSMYQCPTIFPKNVNHTMVVHDIIPRLFPEYLNNWRKRLYWSLTEKAIKRASRIVAVSKNTKRDLVRHLEIPEERIVVSYDDVDEIYKKEPSEKEIESVLEKYGLQKGYVYSGGGLEKRKNMENLILAYKKLLDDGEKVPDLVISGRLMPELAPLVTDVEALVRDLGIENRVKLLGFVDQKDLPVLYHEAKIFVYPSFYEGFGMPVLEAMNQGVTVVASNASSIPEVGGDAVRYFDGENQNDMAEKIKEVLKDDFMRATLSKRVKQRAKEFSWKKFVDDLIVIEQ